MEIKAPKTLCIYDEKHILKTLNFISELYRLAEDETVSFVKIDFSDTEQITAAASVILFANISYLQILKKNSGFFIFNTKKSTIHHSVFIRGKLLRTLMAGSVSKLDRLEQELNFFQSGTTPIEKRKTNRKLLSVFHQQSCGQYKNPIALENFLEKLEVALAEASLNVFHHAYEGIDKEVRWWQGLWYSPKNNQITFILYDLGIGIVDSFSKEKTSANILFPENDPKLEVLKEALRPGSSRFSSIGRGFGSVDILRLSACSPVATMIHSRDVRYTKKNDEERYEISYDIRGTLLEWDLNLPDDEVEND